MKCVVLCSGKGGTGKSCVAAFTGVSLASAGFKTLLLEPGSNARSLDLILDVSDQAFFIEDVLAERCRPEEAVSAVENVPGLFLLGSCGIPEQAPESERWEQLFRELREDCDYDFVLVDGPELSAFPVPVADQFWIVTTPDSLCVRAGARLADGLLVGGARELRLVINNVPAQIIPIQGAQDFDDVIDQIGARLIGVVPASPRLHYCANNACRLDPGSVTLKIFDNLAGRLAGQRRPLLIR